MITMLHHNWFLVQVGANECLCDKETTAYAVESYLTAIKDADEKEILKQGLVKEEGME